MCPGTWHVVGEGYSHAQPLEALTSGSCGKQPSLPTEGRVLFADNCSPIYSFLVPSSSLPASSLREISWKGAEEESGIVSAFGDHPAQWKERMDHEPQTAK